MIDIRKLEEANATPQQIASSIQVYRDLESQCDINLFAKPDNIRIYIFR